MRAHWVRQCRQRIPSRSGRSSFLDWPRIRYSGSSDRIQFRPGQDGSQPRRNKKPSGSADVRLFSADLKANSHPSGIYADVRPAYMPALSLSKSARIVPDPVRFSLNIAHFPGNPFLPPGSSLPAGNARSRKSASNQSPSGQFVLEKYQLRIWASRGTMA